MGDVCRTQVKMSLRLNYLAAALQRHLDLMRTPLFALCEFQKERWP